MRLLSSTAMSMPRSVALALLAGLLACRPDAQGPSAARSDGIIGGVRSTALDFPSAGAIIFKANLFGQDFGSLQCTGTLVAPDVVLTAGHCTVDLLGGAGQTTFYFTFALDVSSFGTTTLDLPTDAVLIRELVPHPSFDFNSITSGQIPPGLGNFYDVGLAFLERPFPGGVLAVIAEADDSSAITAGTPADIAGYGLTQPDGQMAGTKHHARSVINEVAPAEMQIGNYAPTPQKCNGDSGGPTYLAVQDGKLPAERVVGITSRAYDSSNCNRGGVDMRVDFFRDWIERTMIDACTRGVRTSCQGGGAPAYPGTNGPALPDAGAGAGSDASSPAIDAGSWDAGFPDTGSKDAGFRDTGVISPVARDAGFPEDATVYGNPPAYSRRYSTEVEDKSCRCSAAPGPRGAGGGAASSLFALLAALVLGRAERRQNKR